MKKTQSALKILNRMLP
jgi:hypothetical protein